MTKKENQNRGPQVNFTTTVRRVLLTSLVFKNFFLKFGAIAVVSFSMQVVWMYLSQRRGGGGGQRHQHNISLAVRFEN